MQKFYAFNSSEIVRKHISQIRKFRDLLHLANDIKESQTNLTEFHRSTIPGIYEIQYHSMPDTERHLFFTKSAWKKIEELTDSKKLSAASINILED